MGNVLSVVLALGLSGLTFYLGYGVVKDIIAKIKERKNKKGGE